MYGFGDVVNHVEGARLTVTVMNGSKVVCDDVIGIDLTFLLGVEV